MTRLLIFLVASLTVLALPPERQSVPTTRNDEGTSFIIQLKYVKLDLRGRNTNTCIAVSRDGRFHLERAWWGSLPGTGLQIFEGSLAVENVKLLSAILAAEDFKKLEAYDVGQATYQGEIIWAIVPRSEDIQSFFLVGRAGMPMQEPRPLPQSVSPLIEWTQQTAKEISGRKSLLVKGAQPVGCWLQRSWPTAKPAQQVQAQSTGISTGEPTRSEKPAVPDESEAISPPDVQVTDEKKLYSNAVSFVDLPAAELQKAIPELQALEPAQSQEELPILLGKIGDKAVALFRKIPNLICHEEVIESRQGRKLGRRDFDYLILAHHTVEAVSLEEYRVDLRDQPADTRDAHNPNTSTANESASVLNDLRHKSDVASARNAGAPPLSQGFAYKWVHFYPSNRSESTFRYPGRQKIDGHKTFVVAFAQKPGLVRLPGELQYQGKSIPILYQGIAWVDESDSRIVRLRTDLLAPLAAAHLRRLTAEIHFGDARIAESTSPLWLPHEVVVTSDIDGQTFGERHVYSGYRAYLVQSKVVLSP